jgi:hypothetical protein
MANLHQIFMPHLGSNDMMTKDQEDKFKSIYDDDPILKHFNHLEHRKSIMSLVDCDESDFEIRGNLLSRRNSTILSRRNSAALPQLMVSSHHSLGDIDTLDQVVNAATHHNTLYSYHYMDESDKTVNYYLIKFYELNS